MKKYLLLGLMVILCAGLASALPLTVEDIKVDGVSAGNRLSLDRGETYGIEVVFTPSEDINDMEIEAFIAGYEYSHDKPISDSTPSDGYEANITYKEKLTITIPKDVEEDNYKLRIIFSDRDGDELIQTFDLKLDPVRDSLEISDILLSQETVNAGSVLTVVVRIANFGSGDEDNVRIEAEIPELGVKQVAYVDEVQADDEESSEELYLRIPAGAGSGVYSLNVKVSYDRKHQETTSSVQISIRNNTEDEPKTKTVILLGSTLASASADRPAVYPVTITNYAKSTKVFTLSVEGADGWADVQVNPASTILADPQENIHFAVVVTPNKGISAGIRVLTLDIIDRNHSIKQVPLTVNVLESSDSPILYGLGLVAALLLAAVLILGFKKINKNGRNNGSGKSKVDAYY